MDVTTSDTKATQESEVEGHPECSFERESGVPKRMILSGIKLQLFNLVYVFHRPKASQIQNRSLCISLFLSTLDSSVNDGGKAYSTVLLLSLGGVLEGLGAGLLVLLSSDAEGFPAKDYGFEANIEFRPGMCTGVIVLSVMLVFGVGALVCRQSNPLLKNTIRSLYSAAGMGAVGQFRSLGGCTGVTVCVNLLGGYIAEDLSSELSPAQMGVIKLSVKAIDGLSEALQTAIWTSYSQDFKREAVVMTLFGAAGIVVAFLMVEKKLRRQM